MATPKKTEDPFDRFVTGRPRPTTTATLAADPADAQRLADARSRLAVATTHTERVRLQAEVLDITDNVGVIVFTFGAIGADKQADLIALHKPAEDDKNADWNDDFPPALIAETCIGIVYPDGSTADGMSRAKAAAMWDSPNLSTADKNYVFSKALTADLTSSVVDMGKG